jgi:hypothetical protein
MMTKMKPSALALSLSLKMELENKIADNDWCEEMNR